MPVLVLLLIATVAALLATLTATRYPDGPGTTGAEAVVETLGAAAARSSRLRGALRRRRDPETATGLLLSLALLVVLGGGFVLAVLAYLVRGNDGLRDVDSGAARWGNDHASHATERVLTWVTDLGDTRGVAVVVVAVLVAEWLRNRRGLLLIVPFLAIVIIGDQAITTIVKDLAHRARPTFNPIARTLGPSFPSGHSSTAASFYAAVALVLGRRRPGLRAALAGGAVGIAVAVACSRVLLDVHWVSDVVAGLALGWAWFAVCAIAFGGRLLRFGATVVQVEEAVSRPPPTATPRRGEV